MLPPPKSGHLLKNAEVSTSFFSFDYFLLFPYFDKPKKGGIDSAACLSVKKILSLHKFRVSIPNLGDVIIRPRDEDVSWGISIHDFSVENGTERCLRD